MTPGQLLLLALRTYEVGGCFCELDEVEDSNT